MLLDHDDEKKEIEALKAETEPVTKTDEKKDIEGFPRRNGGSQPWRKFIALSAHGLGQTHLSYRT